MSVSRVFQIDRFLQSSDAEPIRSVVTESPDAVVVAWIVLPGQTIAPHVHPHGQDTWTIIAGGATYQVNAEGDTVPVRAGDIVVAARGEVHGARNAGSTPFVFVSVVCPATAGFVPI